MPLLVALDARVRAGAPPRALFRLGLLWGFAFYLTGTHWIARLSDVASTVPWIKYPAWVAAAAYLALFGGLLTLVAGRLARHASTFRTASHSVTVITPPRLASWITGA